MTMTTASASRDWAGRGYAPGGTVPKIVSRPVAFPLQFTAAVADSDTDDPAVLVYLGDQEIIRISGDELVTYDGYIVVDETVARWLSARLA